MSHDITPPPPPPPMPGYGPPIPPQPPKPPGGSRTNLVIVGCAVAVVASVIGTGIVVTNDGDRTASPAPTVTVTRTVAAEDADTTADDGDSSDEGSDEGTEDLSEDALNGSGDTAYDDGVFALDGKVIYESKVEVTLSGFKRGVSSDYAAPENTPYAKFTIKVVNGSDATVDANEMTVDCVYGDEGKEGEAIYDDGLDGLPETRILAGRSLTVPWACELPKGETFLQVEVSPDYDSEEAVFAGEVKK